MDTYHLSRRTSSYPQELTLTQGSTMVDFLWSLGCFLLCFGVLFLFCYVLILWSGGCFVFLLRRDLFRLFAECGEYHSMCMKQKVCMLITQSCLTLTDPMDCRVLCPWDCPGKSTGVGCHFLLQGSSQGSNLGLPHSRQILCHLSPWGSRTHAQIHQVLLAAVFS